MSAVTYERKRRKEKNIGDNATVGWADKIGLDATVAPDDNHADGAWGREDIYKAEFMVNLVDGSVFTRSNDAIHRLATLDISPITVPTAAGKSAWATATSYSEDDVVYILGDRHIHYICISNHVSGTFEDDIANWEMVPIANTTVIKAFQPYTVYPVNSIIKEGSDYYINSTEFVSVDVFDLADWTEFGGGSSGSLTTVEIAHGSTTIDGTHSGKLVQVTITGGNATLTLDTGLSAGYLCYINCKNPTSANAITLNKADAGEDIYFNGQIVTSYPATISGLMVMVVKTSATRWDVITLKDYRTELKLEFLNPAGDGSLVYKYQMYFSRDCLIRTMTLSSTVSGATMDIQKNGGGYSAITAGLTTIAAGDWVDFRLTITGPNTYAGAFLRLIEKY